MLIFGEEAWPETGKSEGLATLTGPTYSLHALSADRVYEFRLHFGYLFRYLEIEAQSSAHTL